MEYDEKTCITAGELRQLSIVKIPDDIPDCAWVPRSSLSICPEGATVDKKNGILTMPIQFTVPFKSISIEMTLEFGECRD